MTSVILAAALAASPISKAQSGVDYMLQAFNNVVSLAEAVRSEVDDLGYDRDLCFGGAFLSVNSKVSFSKTLKRGQFYSFLAAGDEDATDVDVVVTGPNGSRVAADEDTSELAAAAFTADRAGSYTFTVTLADGDNSFIAAALLSDDGWEVPIRNLKVAAGDLAEAIRALSSIGETRFQSGSNKWCLFGAVLPSDETLEMNKVDLVGDLPVVVGACDEQSDDVDLEVKSSSGKVLASDDEEDDNPVCILEDSVSSATLRLTNAGEGTSVSLMAMLTF
jgi:hypothetical protein